MTWLDSEADMFHQGNGNSNSDGDGPSYDNGYQNLGIVAVGHDVQCQMFHAARAAFI